MNRTAVTILISLIIPAPALAQAAAEPVTVDNFARAESDLYMAKNVKETASASSSTSALQPTSTTSWSSA
jgi:hypothetical protein